MLKVDNIPIVEREDYKSKTCKMVITVSIIIIFILYLMFCKSNDHLIYNDGIYEPMLNKKNNEPSLVKFIHITNLSVPFIPINKIVVIDRANNMIPIYTVNAKYTKLKRGFLLEYELFMPVYVRQIIIDIDLDDIRHTHIKNTQIKTLDTDKKTLWEYNEQIHISKYIEINITKPIKEHITPQQILEPNSSINEQESTLNYLLLSNSSSLF